MKQSIVSYLFYFGVLFGCSQKEHINPNPTQLLGLGNVLTQAVSNNVSYDFYFDQGNSGQYSSINCGPSSVTMAIKWVDKTFAKTPEDARNKYKPSGGWWYTSDIINYLNDFSVKNYTIRLTSINLVKAKLDLGDIVILCVDMSLVNPESNSSYHVDKFYQANTVGWGHFIVIKGYKIVDGQIFFESYDPYCFGLTYADHTLKGRDRYYRATNLDKATNNWWDYAIIVTKSGVIGGREPSHPDAVDTSSIPHNGGL